MRLRILHAADLHLDSPFDGLPEGKAVLRRQGQRELLKRLADLARAEQVQIVLLPGDLFDSDIAFAETAEELTRALAGIKVPVFIAPGNHDCYSPSSPYARFAFPENVYIFRNDRIGCVELPELNVRVWGAAFTSNLSRGLLEDFTVEKTEGVTDLLCIHGELAREGRYDPITEAQLKASGIDYAALGHTHAESGLRKAGGTYYAWPGCPEGRGFDETGEKHVYIVELCDGDCKIRPVCIAGGKYGILTVDIGGEFALDAINRALPEATDNDVYRIILKGETDEVPDISALRDALESRFFALSLRDETRIRRELWERASEDSLRGQFLARLKAAYEAAKDEAEREKITQAVRWGLAALDRREEVVRHDN